MNEEEGMLSVCVPLPFYLLNYSLYSIEGAFRTTFTLYPIGIPVRTTITLYIL